MEPGPIHFRPGRLRRYTDYSALFQTGHTRSGYYILILRSATSDDCWWLGWASIVAGPSPRRGCDQPHSRIVLPIMPTECTVCRTQLMSTFGAKPDIGQHDADVALLTQLGHERFRIAAVQTGSPCALPMSGTMTAATGSAATAMRTGNSTSMA
jgi:hypothetical protein